MTDLSQALAWLKALDENSSQGPWHAFGNTFYLREVSRENPGRENFDYFVMPGNCETARLIAHVRNVLPQLIGVVEAAAMLNDVYLSQKALDNALTALAKVCLSENTPSGSPPK